MGLRCSVLGHRYGDREHIEERDQQGSEVVDTARTVKRCHRCGDILVVSESKEVTTTEAPTPQEPAARPPLQEQPVDEAEPDSPEEDDGIILDEEPPERQPGEWPAVESRVRDDPSDIDISWPSIDSDEDDAEAPPPSWPVVEAEDEGFDAVPASEGGTDDIIEAVSTESTGASSGGEETLAGFLRSAPIDIESDPNAELHTEYFCPQCDWTARSLTASVRRGDICPDCHRGYVGERPAK